MYYAGIIGCGKIAELRHAPEYLETKKVKIVGFYDNSFDRAKRLAHMFGGKAFTSVEELLADSNINLISVCTANTSHAEDTIRALEAGKHVIVEKPMAVSIKECEDMVLTAKKVGKRLLLGHNQLFAGGHVMAKKLIDSGVIGKPLVFRTVFGHPGPECWTENPNSWFISKERAFFGVLGDLGIHKIDLMHYLLSDEIVSVSANTATLDKKNPSGSFIDVEDNAQALFKTAKGTQGTLQVSWTYYSGEENSTRIYGTKGLICLYDDPEYAVIVQERNGNLCKMKIDALTSNEEQNAGRRTSTGIIKEFVDAIDEDRPSRADGVQALKAMRVVFAAIESAKTGKEISVSQNE
ncbi:MAG: Gfo/Idh/MocA family oxidoreductase [Eubacteriales bacterium]|nr:Gfo/Idh/MocA family oxidoreductase [Eubacteriales bacterium]